MPPKRMRSPALTLLTAAPAYTGAGHLGTGAELYWRHIERCSKEFASPLETGASLGDDFSAGNRGQITSLDFSAFDQTTTLTRFRQVALSFIVGATHEQNNPFYCSAVVGYHECLAHQLQLASGYYIPGRSAWPSAVPRTSYGDSFPATSAGINIILSTEGFRRQKPQSNLQARVHSWLENRRARAQCPASGRKKMERGRDNF